MKFDNIKSYSKNKKKPNFEKPPATYFNLILEAIKNSPEGRLTLDEIYEFLKKNYECFRNEGYEGWKNSIRHNLSADPCFIKIPKNKGKRGKGHFWKVNPDANDQFIENTTRRRPRGYREKIQPKQSSKINKTETKSLPNTNISTIPINNFDSESAVLVNYNQNYLSNNNQFNIKNNYSSNHQNSSSFGSNISFQSLENQNFYFNNLERNNYDLQNQSVTRNQNDLRTNFYSNQELICSTNFNHDIPTYYNSNISTLNQNSLPCKIEYNSNIIKQETNQINNYSNIIDTNNYIDVQNQIQRNQYNQNYLSSQLIPVDSNYLNDKLDYNTNTNKNEKECYNPSLPLNISNLTLKEDNQVYYENNQSNSIFVLNNY